MNARRLQFIIDAHNRSTRAFDEVEDRLRRMNERVRIANERYSAMSARLQSVGTSMTIGLTVPLIALAKASFDSFVQFDSLERGMISVTGSAAAARAEFAQLKVVAKLPGLGFKEAIQGSINLQAAGASADDARKYLMAFGNALATVGKGKVELDGVNLALTQLMNRSSGFGQEIRQLQERLPQIRQIMIKAFGTADSEVIGKMGVTGKQFVDIIAAEFARLPKMTGGAKNAIENLGDAWFIASSKIGKSLAPVMVRAIDQLTKMAKTLGELNPKIIDMGVKWGAVFGMAGPVLLGINQTVTAFRTLKEGIIFLRNAWLAYIVTARAAAVASALAWAAAAAPVVAVAAVGTAIVGAGMRLIDNGEYEERDQSFEDLADSEARMRKRGYTRTKEGGWRSPKQRAAIKAKEAAKAATDFKAKMGKTPSIKMPKMGGVKKIKDSDLDIEDEPTPMERADAKAQDSLQWFENSLTLDELTIKDMLTGVERILDKKNKMYNSMSKGVRATIYAKRNELMTSLESERTDKLDTELDTLIRKQELQAQKDGKEIQKARDRIANYYEEQQADFEMSAIAAENGGDKLGADLTRNFANYQRDLESVAKIGRTGVDVTKQRALVDAKKSAADRSVTQNFAKNIWDRIQAMREEADEYVRNIQRQIQADRDRERSRIKWTNSDTLWRDANVQGASAVLNRPLPFFQLQNNGSDPTQNEVVKATSDTASETKKMNDKLDTMISLLGLQPEGATF